LRRKVLAKLKKGYLQTVGSLTIAVTDLSDEQRKSAFEDFWRDQRQRADKYLRQVPDKEFETIMKDQDRLPTAMQKVVKDSLGLLPKNRGGRPSEFSLEIRRSAIRDIGPEYSQCDSFREAIERVAHRYGMRPNYLRKVWKNRKRLRTDQ